MIDLMLAQVFAQAALLCLLLYLFARSEADFNFRKVSVVTAFLSLCSILLEGLLKDTIGLWFLLPTLALTAFILNRYCWVSWWKALIIAGIFIAAGTGIMFLTTAAPRSAGANLQANLTRAASAKEQLADIEKIRKENTDLSFLKEFAGTPTPTLNRVLPSDTNNTESASSSITSQAVSIAQTASPIAAPPIPPTPPQPSRTVRRPTDSNKKFILKGISQGPGGRIAFINTSTVVVGETVDGAVVERITHNQVYLRYNEETVIITMQ